MPRLTLFAAALTALALASCGAKTDDTHGTTTDPKAAIGFMTENPTPPDTATISRDDGVYRDIDGRPYGYGLLGKMLPAFEGEFINSDQSFNSRNIDKWTVIDVWGIWCGDCMADAPYVAALNTAIQQDPDLDFISIHVPSNENRTAPDDMFGKYGSVEAYFSDKGYNYPTLIDENTDLRNALQIPWTPSYLLVSPDGVVRGYRTDLSVAGGDPVKDFIRDIAKVRGEVSLNSFVLPDQTHSLTSIGPDGAAGVKEPISFNMPVIVSAFSAHSITASTIVRDGSPVSVFNVMYKSSGSDRPVIITNDQPLFVLEGSWDAGHVAIISTQNNLAEGPAGERVGVSTFDDLSATLKANCKTMPESPNTVCSQIGSAGTFQRIYGLNGSHGSAPLIEMRYLPKSPKNR